MRTRSSQKSTESKYSYGLYTNRKFSAFLAAIAAKSRTQGIYTQYTQEKEECLQQPKPNYKRRPRPKIVGCLGRYRAAKKTRGSPPRAAAKSCGATRNRARGTLFSFWSLCGLCAGVVRAAAGSHLVDWVGEV